MKFKIDENLPEELCSLFRAAGWDCRSVVEQNLGGAADSRVLEVCAAEERILVSFDRGFSNIGRHSASGVFGVILFRLRSQDKPLVLSVAARLVASLAARPMRGQLWIVHETRIRIRKL